MSGGYCTKNLFVKRVFRRKIRGYFGGYLFIFWMGGMDQFLSGNPGAEMGKENKREGIMV